MPSTASSTRTTYCHYSPIGIMNKTAIQQIKSRLDFVELAGRYLELRPNGERWSGPCPFHHETHPSFHVNPGQGFYYCFGCQASGDAIDFYARINGLDFRQALTQLARETGVELDDGPTNPQDKKILEDREIYLRMYVRSAAYFQENFVSSKGGMQRKYLLDRGVSPEMIDAFQIGCSREDWHGLEKFLLSEGYDQDKAVTCGLLVRNDQGKVYDRFRNRIMFPIHDLAGAIIAFGGRAIDSSEPKYINSSETPIYTKGKHLYGLYQARRTIVRDKRALLTEGYLDVVALHQFGFTGAVGVLGTALTQDQVKRLGGLCPRVDLLFDGDQAGLKAAVRAAEMFLIQGIACNVATMPEGRDVDDVLHGQGPEALGKILDSARSGLEFCVQTISRTYAPRDIMDWVRRFLDSIPGDDLRAYYLPRLATGLGMSETELRRSRFTSASSSVSETTGASSPDSGKSTAGKSRLTTRDRQLLAFAVSCPEYRSQLATGDLEAVLEDPWALRLWTKLRAMDAEHLTGKEDGSSESSVRPGFDYTSLDEDERRVCYQLLAEVQQRGEPDRGVLWTEIQTCLNRNLLKKKQQDMLRAMREAQNQGDQQRVAELLQAYQDLAMEA
ncbi:DNA primase [Desulfonatronum thiosulfatophilum]|uniref:DNA primase n=1 Tax=Desulfonatronum thiosulfatophilum TaxID=617002 RepID=A0A1G6BA82_9BACT|nr:DNA primase [Desulfonatronum thiosulfatophilum]SDB17572.1 DNA primase [Desulfonatronum thiosulfatophilum]